MEDVVREHELQLTQQAIALRELWTQVFPFTPWPL